MYANDDYFEKWMQKKTRAARVGFLGGSNIFY
jgi:hypothetical protein